MKTTWFAALAALALPLAQPREAKTCGMPYGVGVNVDPRQDIVLVFKDKKETYVFQPYVYGDAKDFGLILPIPTKLEGMPELANAKMFEAAKELSKPKVVARTECRSDFGAADAGASDAPGRGGGSDPVISRGTVGFLDWVQIRAETSADLKAWLDSNGFPYDAAALGAFDGYVRDKWAFVAFKVRQEAVGSSTLPTALGPIKLTFGTEQAVVPTRIASASATGIGYTWTIYGVTKPTEQLNFGPTTTSPFAPKLGFSGVFADPVSLSAFVGLASVGDRLTKISVFFGPGTSSGDLTLTTTAPVDYQETVYNTTYIDCPADAGPDTGPGADTGPSADSATEGPKSGGSAGGSGCTVTTRSDSHPVNLPVSGGIVLGLAMLGLVRRRNR